MIRLHMALPGVGLAIDVAPAHIVSLTPCDEGVLFDSHLHPGAHCIVRTVCEPIYVTETRDTVLELCCKDRGP